jgi:hypothetical protein
LHVYLHGYAIGRHGPISAGESSCIQSEFDDARGIIDPEWVDRYFHLENKGGLTEEKEQERLQLEDRYNEYREHDIPHVTDIVISERFRMAGICRTELVDALRILCSQEKMLKINGIATTCMVNSTQITSDAEIKMEGCNVVYMGKLGDRTIVQADQYGGYHIQGKEYLSPKWRTLSADLKRHYSLFTIRAEAFCVEMLDTLLKALGEWHSNHGKK